MVYGCHLRPLLRSWGGYWWFLWELWVLFDLGLILSRLRTRLVGCVQSWELGVGAWPFEVYPAGKLQLHFTCGFDFRQRPCALSSEVYPAGKLQWRFTYGFNLRHGLWLPFAAAFAVLRGLLMVPVGTMGSFWPGVNPFQAPDAACGLCPELRAWRGCLAFRGLSCG